ncbi:hypothetical protein NDU88_001100 [Pleurodeles waltl]|uniref:Uncharacterized protein n=1 Tax=Pleurodeles waltl TaxID=8319 RepID=A0AAV7LZI2_PLEWA|nr:hypothetical protein NDU88_001100 [Pleurodeles waltl]
MEARVEQNVRVGPAVEMEARVEQNVRVGPAVEMEARVEQNVRVGPAVEMEARVEQNVRVGPAVEMEARVEQNVRVGPAVEMEARVEQNVRVGPAVEMEARVEQNVRVGPAVEMEARVEQNVRVGPAVEMEARVEQNVRVGPAVEMEARVRVAESPADSEECATVVPGVERRFLIEHEHHSRREGDVEEEHASFVHGAGGAEDRRPPLVDVVAFRTRAAVCLAELSRGVLCCRSAYGALRVPILKVLHLLFRGSSALCRQRGSGWLSFSILKHTVLHIAFARRGRALPASHGPGSDLSSRAAPPGPCSSPPPLRLLRS